ncbi:MAG: hypothetical protein O2816_17030 [Planctomycetota bacterium]|nr:hypothetical protein [Planctomycetota bacterium]
MSWLRVLLIVFGGVALGQGREAAQALDEARDQLRSSYPDARARAVRKLAQLGAWKEVREALEDRDAQVADAAQLAMAEVTDPEVLRDWLGRAGLRDRDPWVRLRIVQVLGAVALRVPARDLVGAIDPRDQRVTRAVCASLEALGRRGNLEGIDGRVLEALEGVWQRGRDEAARADALAALMGLGSSDGWRLIEASYGEQEALVRAAAVRLDGGPGWRGRLERVAADTDPRVRLACLERLRDEPTRFSVELLVDRLEQEPRLRLRLAIVAQLCALSGLKHRDDPRPWRRWLQALPADWTPEEVAAEEEDDGPRTDAGLGAWPLPSDRIAILVDLSGSLWVERKDGTSRKTLLDDELRALLERLPRDAAFNLVPYATTPDPWRPALVPAEPRHVRAALAEFEGSRLTGKGNVWDALLVVLADPAVDTVLIVTDGAPTGGHRWDLDLMAELIERERRWSGVAISSVLVDSSKQLQKRWATIAERTGGTSIAVAFEPAGPIGR